MIPPGIADRPDGGDAYADVPMLLKDARRWLLWKAAPAGPGKKDRKIPYYVGGGPRQGELDCPADWDRLVTFDEALAALCSRQYAGLGFALGPDASGLCWQGIDLDDIADHPGLEFVADDLPGYTEDSVSGRGKHAIGYGRPFRTLGSNGTGIEAYASGRFFVMTGDKVGLGEVTCIADFVDGQLARIHDLQRAPTGKLQTDSISAPTYVDGLQAGLLAAELKDALRRIPADDYGQWIAVGHALKTLGPAGKSIWLAWSRISNKYDAAEAEEKWESFRPTRTGCAAIFAEAQRRGWTNPRGVGSEAEGPETSAPLPQTIFDPWRQVLTPTFPLDATPPVLREFAVMQAASTGADVSACAMAALAVCSGALSHSFTLKMKRSGDWIVRPRLWVALVGSSSSMKTPVINGAMAPLRALDRELSSAHRKEMAKWEAAKKDDPKAEKPPPVLRLISNDTSSEKLGEILARQDRGIMFLGDELSGWLGAMDKYSGGARGASADRAFWLESYNGGDKHVDRIGRGEIYIENCSVSILGGIQPAKLEALRDLASDGLLQRFLPVMMGKANRSAEVDGSLAQAAYYDRVRLLADMRACQVIMDDAALDVAKAFQAFTFDMMQVEGLGESFISFLGKLNGVHGSLMLLLHFLSDPQNAPYSPVTRRTAGAAAQILREFCIPHAMALYQTTTDGVDWEYLRSAASYVLTSDKERFTMSDFTSGVHALRGLGVWHVQQKISPLVAGGWLVEEETGGVAKAWTLVEGLRDLMADRRKTEAERKAVAMRAYHSLSRGKPGDL